MASCFTACIKKVFPKAGWITIGLIVAGLLLAAAQPEIPLTLAAVAAICGVSIGSTAAGMLLGCLLHCI